jgi:CHAD domain-containing protein
MSASPKSAAQGALLAAQRQQRPRINSTMACDTAFRVVARRCLEDLTANHAATCRGDPIALHQMRIALTALRTAISFFSPMVIDSRQIWVKRELKWLNTQLGTVRDLDVAIERLNDQIAATASDAVLPTLETEARAGHRRLARSLLSTRFRRLVEGTSGWAENGPWSTAKTRRAARQRASPIAAYSAHKLTGWLQNLLRKSRKLGDMGAEKRHRLRLTNKKLCYSIEFLEDLFPDKNSKQRIALKHLRKAQKSLGQLNDDATAQSLAAALSARPFLPSLGPKSEKRLVRTTAAAYRKLTALKPAFA